MKQRRGTRQRQLVLEAVRAHDDHPSADQIYIEVRMLDSKISRGTVYRNLNCLAEDGEITHVRVPGADRYDRRMDLHYHLICMDCRTVIDVPTEYEPEMDQMVVNKTGYLITRHRTVFEGLCPACQKKQTQEAENK